MVTIRMVTWVDAPVERCFKLATNVGFLLASAKSKNIKAVEGVKNGSLEQGDTVTWQGQMYGLGRTHTSRIEVLRPFHYVREVMVAGAFNSMNASATLRRWTMGLGSRMRCGFLPT